jgi:hypothetical protein
MGVKERIVNQVVQEVTVEPMHQDVEVVLVVLVGF